MKIVNVGCVAVCVLYTPTEFLRSVKKVKVVICNHQVD